MTWDTTQYLRYADERSRPFDELVTRILSAGLSTSGKQPTYT